MVSKALIKKKDRVEIPTLCRWCLSPTDALEDLANDDSGQYKVQKIFDFASLQMIFSPAVPSYLCTMCEGRLKKMDRFRWRCNEKNDMVDRFIKQQNTAKNESDVTQEHLDHSAVQTVGTELSIKTEVSSPDAAYNLHSNQKCCIVHEAKRTYECCGNIPDDLFEAEENPTAIKSEYEEIDEQDNIETNTLQSESFESGIGVDAKGHKRINTDKLSSETLDVTHHVCETCYKTFRSRKTLKEHSKIHKDGEYHQCTECPSKFVKLYQMKKHIRTHTDERPYQCKVCDKTYKTSGTLTEHLKMHNKDQQHQCPHCSSNFKWLSQLKIHIRTHTGERPFQCKVCDKAFHSSRALGKHSKIHNKDQQHQCPHCPSTFVELFHLKVHIRSHTGERPFQCKVCDKAFRSSGSLTEHLRIHNKDQQHQCPHCSSRFAQTSNLKMHIRTHARKAIQA